jgi:transcriptional regulator with XRE-family HTH domain
LGVIPPIYRFGAPATGPRARLSCAGHPDKPAGQHPTLPAGAWQTDKSAAKPCVSHMSESRLVPRRLARHARSRTLEQIARIAAEIRVARARLAVSQSELARRAGVVHSTIERIESGSLDVQLSTLTAVSAAAGLDLVLNAYPRPGLRLRDAGQLALIDQLRRVAAPLWHARVEVAAGDHGRSADLVLYGAEEIIHIEVERRALDWQAQVRSGLRKREFLAARSDRPVRFVVAIEDTRRNREALRLHMDLIRAQLPATSREVLASMRRGRPLGRDGLLWIRRR